MMEFFTYDLSLMIYGIRVPLYVLIAMAALVCSVGDALMGKSPAPLLPLPPPLSPEEGTRHDQRYL